MDCSCNGCKSACEKKPGWFSPGEIERAAALLSMTTEDFFQQYVGVDFWEEETSVFVLAPRTKRMEGVSVYPFDPRGECIFYEGGACKIHGAKPSECAFYDHTKSTQESEKHHELIMIGWKGEQKYIEKLYGEKPVAPENDGSINAFSKFFGGF